jgi:predicted aspartyl protease
LNIKEPCNAGLFLFLFPADNDNMTNLRNVVLTVSIICSAISLAGESPFDPSRGLVELPVVVNGVSKGIFGIDTGADRLYVDKSFAESNRLGKTYETKSVVRGIDGVSAAHYIQLGSIKFADESLYDIDATVVDLSLLTGDVAGGIPNGLIGFDVLRRFYVTADFPSQVIHLDQSWPDVLAGSDVEEIPFELFKHYVMVDVLINDNAKARMMLDYCASYTIVTPEFAERIGMSAERGVIPSMTIGQSTTTADVKVAVVDHANIQKGNPQLHIDGILGGTFFYPHVITVDYRRSKIYVQR